MVPIIQAADDVNDSLTPRNPAKSGRSTTARIWSPIRVWRISAHSATATTTATTSTAHWLLLMRRSKPPRS